MSDYLPVSEMNLGNLNLSKAQLNDIFKIIKRGEYERSDEEEKIKFLLNFDLAQCKSKTALALQHIALLHYKKKQKYKYNTNKIIKLISIVFTDNSLLQTAAWKDRTAAKFKNGELIVQRLASDSEKKGKDYSRGVELISAFATFSGKENNKNKLGDILVMCNHPVRINDIIEVIEINRGLTSKRGVEFKYNIYFDECDASRNLTNLVRFMKEIYNKKLNYYIDEVQLITATPTKEMHEKLIRITPDANKLFNIKKEIQTEDSAFERIKDYRTILDQEFIAFEGPQDPVDYVKDLGDKLDVFEPGKIYFVPSHHYCSEHEKMAQLEIFKINGYHVLILNGKNKEVRSPLGIKTPIMKDLKKCGELRDILRDWRIQNPRAGLIITGKMVLERGLTFLTDGFNFDGMIISGYFAKNIPSLVQLVGRGQGNEKYVDNFKVIMPQSLYDAVKKYIEDSETLLNEDPEFFDQDMLAKIGMEDKSNTEEPIFRDTIDEIADFVKEKLKTKNKKRNRTIRIKIWKNKRKNEDGFIMHKFAEHEEKVWTKEEAKTLKGGIAPYGHRIIPCYSDINNVNSLTWCLIYRKD
jgi:hypothetical protein